MLVISCEETFFFKKKGKCILEKYLDALPSTTYYMEKYNGFKNISSKLFPLIIAFWSIYTH